MHTADGYRYYTDFSLWDTFRAAHPLYTIIDQKRTRDFVAGSDFARAGAQNITIPAVVRRPA